MRGLIRFVVTVAVVAVVTIAGLVVVARTVFGCTPPRDQARMIDLFKADPLFATAPEDGQLVNEYAHTYACDNGHGNSPTSPDFAEVRRLYKTPAACDAQQLHQRFDQPAATAGWRKRSGDLGQVPNGGGDISYCKEAGGRASIAYLSSSAGKNDRSTHSTPGVEVLLSAYPQYGSTCDSIS